MSIHETISSDTWCANRIRRRDCDHTNCGRERRGRRVPGGDIQEIEQLDSI
jgi:hypothetical protein